MPAGCGTIDPCYAHPRHGRVHPCTALSSRRDNDGGRGGRRRAGMLGLAWENGPTWESTASDATSDAPLPRNILKYVSFDLRPYGISA